MVLQLKKNKTKNLVVAFQLAALTIPRALIALDVSLGASCQWCSGDSTWKLYLWETSCPTPLRAFQSKTHVLLARKTIWETEHAEKVLFGFVVFVLALEEKEVCSLTVWGGMWRVAFALNLYSSSSKYMALECYRNELTHWFWLERDKHQQGFLWVIIL